MEWLSFSPRQPCWVIFLLISKNYCFLYMLVNNVLLPLSLMPFFHNRKIITSWSISERKERNIPLIITTVLYCTTSYIILKFPLPLFLKVICFFSCISFTDCYFYKFLVEDITSLSRGWSNYRPGICSLLKNAYPVRLVSVFCNSCRRIDSFFQAKA